MTAEQLEIALVAEITALGMIANPFPHTPERYVPNALSGEILVRYCGAEFSGRDLSSMQVQRVQRVEIIAIGQMLHGEYGIYDCLERIRSRLDGYTMPGAGGHLEIESEEFSDHYNGTWQFLQKWRLKSTIFNEQQDHYADRPLRP